jgi:hypothetical protein
MEGLRAPQFVRRKPMLEIRRREVITFLGSAAAWPLTARAQQRPMPVMGYISGRTADSHASMLVAGRGNGRLRGKQTPESWRNAAA